MSNQNRGGLTIACGCARAGKTTFAKKWQSYEDHETLNEMYNRRIFDHPSLFLNPRVVVCMDKFRLALYGTRYNGYLEGLVSFLKPVILNWLLDSGYDVYSDGTNTTASSLKRLFQLDPNAKVVFFDTEPQICKERAAQTNQSDLVPIIDRMYNNLKQMWNNYCPTYNFGMNKEFDLHDLDEWQRVFNKIRNEVKYEEPRIV
jgi:hypothetical protein